MKKFLGLALVALLAAAPAQGQITDGATGTATFLGNTSTTNAPWFEFDVSTGAFSGSVDFICVDATVYVYQSTLYDVSFSDLALAGSDIAGYDITRLRNAALAYDYVAANGLQGNYGAQVAIWNAMGTLGNVRGADNTTSGWVLDLSELTVAEQTAFTNVTGYMSTGTLDFSRYSYFLMTGTNNYRGTMQPQLTRVGVPEPGTTILLASGLLGLFAVGYRRTKANA